MIYKGEYHPQVKKDLKKLSPKLRQIVREEHIPAILLNPDKGKPLVGDLNGVFSYHLKLVKQQYRIAYGIEEKTKTVFVLMIGKRGEFYKLLQRRV